MDSAQIHHRSDYRSFLSIQTRWMDNDVYGHVNNVQYYSFFDTAVNEYLIRSGALDASNGRTIGLVVETKCQYLLSVAFPDVVDVGLRVAKIGRTSVRYEVALFRAGFDQAAAIGHFVHVFVDRDTRRPVEIPVLLRQALGKLENRT